MTIANGPYLSLLGGLAVALAALPATAGEVDIRLTPTGQTVNRCDIVEIDLVVASNDGEEQLFDAVDAIITWDPGKMELVGLDDSRAEAEFFLFGFLPDPDHINDDIQDGEALFTALAPPGDPIAAPPDPDELIVITFQFQALYSTPGTDLAFEPMVGNFGVTRVLFEGRNITGDISSVSTTQIGSCPGDIDANGVVEFADILLVLVAWGPCDGCCPEDESENDVVDFADILPILTNWGPCP